MARQTLKILNHALKASKLMEVLRMAMLGLATSIMENE